MPETQTPTPTLEEIIAQTQKEVDQRNSLQTSMNLGMRYNPDERARAQKIAADGGLNPDMVAEDLNAYEKLRRAESFRAQDYTQRAPKSAQWFMEPRNAEVAWDEHQGIASLEEAHALAVAEENAKSGKTWYGGLGAALAEGGLKVLALPYTLASVGNAASNRDPQELKRREQGWQDALKPFYMANQAAESFAKDRRATENILLTDPTTGKQSLNWSAISPTRAAGLENMANIVASEALPMAITYAVALVTTPETGGMSLEAATAANAGKFAKLAKLGQAVAHYAKSPVGWVNSARVVQGQYEQGIQDVMEKNPGMTVEQAKAKVAPGALLAGALSPLFGGVMEVQIMEDLATKVARSPGGFGIGNKILARLKSFGAVGAKEAAQEALEGIGEDLSAWVTYQPDKTIKDAAGNMVMNALGGFLVGGGAGSLAHGSRSIQMAQQEDFFNAIHEGAKDSKLLKRMPEKWQEVIGKITQDGPLENVGIPAEQWQTLWQSKGLTGEQAQAKAVELLGVTPEQYQAALQLRDDLTVKTDVFATRVAGTEVYPELSQDVRFQQGTLTTREAEAAKLEEKTKVDEILARFATEPESEAVKQIAGLKEQMKAQLVAGGRPALEAEAQAALFERSIVTMAVRNGMEPEALLGRFNLTVNGGEVMAQAKEGTQTQGGTDLTSPTGGVTHVVTDGQSIDLATGDTAPDPQTLNQSIRPKSEEQLRVEREATALYSDPKTEEAYNAMPEAKGGAVLNVDLARKLDPNFLTNPTDVSGWHHRQVGDFIKRLFKKRMAMSTAAPDEVVVFLAGGGGSGKSTVDRSHSISEGAHTVLDGVFGNPETSLANIELALNSGRRFALNFIYRPIDKAIEGSIWRTHEDPTEHGRVLKLDVQATDHEMSPVTVLEAIRRFGDNPHGRIYAFDNSQGPGEAVRVPDPKSFLESLPSGVQIAEKAHETYTQIREQGYVHDGSRKPLSPDAQRVYDESHAALQGKLEAGRPVSPLDGPGSGSPRPEGSEGDQRLPGLTQTLFQPEGSESKRGFLQIGPDHTFDIGLLDKANVSTAAHEFGHFYLEVLRDLASQEGSTQQTKDDFQTILKHFGEDGKVTELTHERFADAHLLYLQEGRAPSAELQPAFQRFSAWLSKIWQIVKSDMIGVELNDDVRGVFDRIYATDSEIEAVKYDLGKPMFATAEAAGMTQERFDLYSRTEAKRIAEGKEKLLSRLMLEMQRAQSRERRDLYRQVHERIRGEVEARPEYVALLSMVSDESGLKLSKNALQERGVDLKALGKDGIRVVYSSESNMDPDTAATLLVGENGQPLFRSGDALIQAITGLESRVQLAERMAEDEVRQTFPDTLQDPAALRKAALEVLADSDNAARVMAIELQAIRKKQNAVAPFLKAQQQELTTEQRQQSKDRAELERAQAQIQREQEQQDRQSAREAAKLPDMSAFRQAAVQMIQGMQAYGLIPFRFLQAQRKAANEAFKAMARNDYEGAAKGKELEILNHFLYLEAVKVQDDLDRFETFDKRFDKASTREKMGKAGGSFLEQIDALRLRFGLSSRQVENMGIRTETLAQWVAGNEFAEVSDQVVNEGWKKPIKEMSVSELNQVWDALKNIKALAYQKSSVLVAGRRIDLETAEAEMVQSITLNNIRTPVPLSGSKLTFKQEIINKLRGFDATMVKMEALVNWMDGGDVNGPAHRYIWNPLAEAQTLRYDMTVKIAEPLQEAFRQMPEPQRKSLDDLFTVEGFGQPLTRKQILSMLFNMGNEANKAKLLKGYGWTEHQVMAALSNLNVEDAAFVQSTWNTLETLWPEMVALEKRYTGVEPKKQEIQPFTLYGKSGEVVAEMQGGYWPLKYDPKGGSDVASKQNAGDRIMQGTAARPGTSRSAVKERTQFTGELLLDFGYILTQHINDVIMDISHREALTSADRLLRRPEVKMAIQEAFGPEYYAQLNPWLKGIAGDGSSAAAMGLSVWSSAAMGLRSNSIAAVLGFKFTSAIVQFADLTRVLGPGDYRVKARHFTSAFFQMLGSPAETIAMVREMSGEMRHRAENLDRDIRETLNHMTGQQSLKDRYNRAGFKGLAFMDALISVPTWLGAYQQAMAEHGDSERGVMEADRVVRLKLMSGNPKDMVAVQRDNEMMKLITMFLGDASSGYNMMRNAGHKAKGLGGFVTQFAPSALIIMAGAVIGDLLKGQGPDDDEDPALWALRKAALAPFQTVPGLRDGVRALDAKLAGKPFSDYQFTPAFSAVQKVINGIDVTADMLGSEKEVEPIDWAIKSGEALGYAFGIGGTAQAAGGSKYLRRVDEGEENPENTAELVWNTLQNKPKKSNAAHTTSSSDLLPGALFGAPPKGR